MRKNEQRSPPDICPSCGAEVPATALACPECGADYETGWNQENAVYDGVDLPDDDFAYDEYLKKEFGEAGETGRRDSRKWIWLCIVAVILVLLVLFIVCRGFGT